MVEQAVRGPSQPAAGRWRKAGFGLVRACHPEPAAAVTIFAVVLAIALGRSALGVAFVALAVLAGQLSVGWHNDWVDAARDRAAGRRDKPIAIGTVSRRFVGQAALLALSATVPLSLLSGVEAAGAHLFAVALAWSYNARLKATIVSFVPYVVAFPGLAAFVFLGGSGHPWPPWWVLATVALLGAGAHLLNAAPDLANDLAAGIRGLPQRIRRPASVTGAAALLLGATAVVSTGQGLPAWVPIVAIAGSAGVLGAGWWVGRRPGSRALFRAALIVAALDVVVLVARLKLW